MKILNKAILILSVFAVPLFACGGSDAEEGAPDTQALSADATEPADVIETTEVGQSEQGLGSEFGNASCNNQGYAFARCSAPIYHKASRGCLSKKDGSIIWQESKNCWGCTDKGSFVTCWN